MHAARNYETGIIAVVSQFMTFHLRDTLIYKVSDKLSQLTDDHTFVNHEVKLGNMTPEEALTDPRRNDLIQCIGVTDDVFPDVKLGDLESGVNYMTCLDIFRHAFKEKELFEELSPQKTAAAVFIIVHISCGVFSQKRSLNPAL